MEEGFWDDPKRAESFLKQVSSVKYWVTSYKDITLLMDEVDVLLDDWTVVTIDGGLAAHYENTVVINDGEPELLTL